MISYPPCLFCPKVRAAFWCKVQILSFFEQEEAGIEVDVQWAPCQLLRLMVGCLKGWDFSLGEKYVGIFFFCFLGWKGTLTSGKDSMLRD